MNAGGKKLPLLVTENYGRGRTAVFATGGSWRWRMQQPVGDMSQETFWRQLLRWVVSATPGRVVASTPNAQLEDDGTCHVASGSAGQTVSAYERCGRRSAHHRAGRIGGERDTAAGTTGQGVYSASMEGG